MGRQSEGTSGEGPGRPTGLLTASTPAAVAALERLRAENALLLRMLSEAQVTIRALVGIPYVPSERLAELTRARLDKVEYR